MNRSTITARQARQALFAIDSEAADTLRQRLFDEPEQDQFLLEDLLKEVSAVLGSSRLLAITLENGPATVKELAVATCLSESRVRELIASMGTVLNDGGRPAKFWIESEADSVEQDQEAIKADDSSDDSICPFCDAENSDMTPAGPEGTFLGDSVLLCHKCGKAHNIFSKVEVSLPEGRKSRKSPLNPQYKIDAKVAAVEAVGGTLTYDKTSRLWALQLPQHKTPVLMTSQEFSLLDHKTIVNHV